MDLSRIEATVGRLYLAVLELQEQNKQLNAILVEIQAKDAADTESIVEE